MDGTATIQAVALAEDLPGSRVSSGTFEFAPPQPPPIAIRPEELDEKVLFETGTAKLDPRSAPLLDAVAVALLAHGEIDRVLIEGHTDAKGNEAFNEKLSQDRAEAVREYLIDKGVPPDRLDAQGFGSNRPIADNGTPEGREANRRVEFVVAPAAAGTEQMGTGSGR